MHEGMYKDNDPSIVAGMIRRFTGVAEGKTWNICRIFQGVIGDSKAFSS